MGFTTWAQRNILITGSPAWSIDPAKDRIELLYKDGTLRDIAEASDNLGIQALACPVEKWYLAWPRWV